MQGFFYFDTILSKKRRKNDVRTTKKIIFSGMQPSGLITLGNYLGALNNWRKLQDEYNCLYCIVDMHAITVRQDPSKLRKQAKELLLQYLTVGLDPQKSILYYQSHVPPTRRIRLDIKLLYLYGRTQ